MKNENAIDMIKRRTTEAANVTQAETTGAIVPAPGAARQPEFRKKTDAEFASELTTEEQHKAQLAAAEAKIEETAKKIKAAEEAEA